MWGRRLSIYVDVEIPPKQTRDTPPPTASAIVSKKVYQWTDDDMALLLSVILEYKTKRYAIGASSTPHTIC